MKQNQGWHERGYLQHFNVDDSYQFITYRLHDSLPKEVMLSLDELNKNKHNKKFLSIEKVLDQGYGDCLLENATFANIVINNWHYFDQKSYDLMAWVIMPNHVHVVIKVYPNQSLTSIVHSWKSYTARMINKVRETTGPVWQRDYWDRIIRTEAQMNRIIHYIEENPVKAGLTKEAKTWHWSHLRTASSLLALL